MRAAERRGLIVAFGVFGVFWGSWSAVLPAIRTQAGLSDGQLGVALAAVAFAAVPVMPLAGRLVDRFGAARAVPVTLACFGLLVPLFTLAHSQATLIPPLVLLGLTTGAMDVVINTATAAWERAERSRLMSVAHGSFSVGVLIGSIAAGLAREAGSGPTPIMLAVAVLVLVVAVSQPAYRAVDDQAEPGTRSRLSAVLIGIGLLTAAAFLCEDATQSWSALHLERGLHASPAVSGLGPGLFAGAMAVGRLGSGLMKVRDTVLFGSAASLLTVGVLVVALAPSAAVALVGLVVAGAGTSVLAPLLYSSVGSRAAPGRQGADLAKVSALGYTGFCAGPPLVGLISAASSLPVALGCLAVLGVVLTAVGPLVLRAHGPVLEH